MYSGMRVRAVRSAGWGLLVLLVATGCSQLVSADPAPMPTRLALLPATECPCDSFMLRECACNSEQFDTDPDPAGYCEYTVGEVPSRPHPRKTLSTH